MAISKNCQALLQIHVMLDRAVKGSSAGTDRVHAGPFTNCSPCLRAFPLTRQTVHVSVTSSVATLTDMCLIADTPVGTTKLELRLEARFALRLLYDVSIVAAVPVLMMLRDAIVFTS